MRFLLLALALAMSAAAQSDPTPLTDAERADIYKAQYRIAAAQSEALALKARLDAEIQNIKDLSLSLQQMLRRLQQEHAAVGFDLTESLEWAVQSGAAGERNAPDPGPKPVPDPPLGGN